MKKWQIVSIIILILLILILFFWPKECGEWTLTGTLKYEDCGCIGLKFSSASEGAGNYYCWGICLKNTCEKVSNSPISKR